LKKPVPYSNAIEEACPLLYSNALLDGLSQMLNTVQGAQGACPFLSKEPVPSSSRSLSLLDGLRGANHHNYENVITD
jgi:hypothetical protein